MKALSKVTSPSSSKKSASPTKSKEFNLSRLESLLKEQKNSKTLSIVDQFLGDSGAERLAEFLSNNFYYTEIKLRGNNISSRGFTMICNALKRSTHLESLSCEWNLIGDQLKGLEELHSLVQRVPTIQSLDFRNNRINSTAAHIICSIIRDALHLRHFDLSWNEIGQEGGLQILETLRQKKRPINVELKGNKIDPEVLKEIHSYGAALNASLYREPTTNRILSHYQENVNPELAERDRNYYNAQHSLSLGSPPNVRELFMGSPESLMYSPTYRPQPQFSSGAPLDKSTTARNENVRPEDSAQKSLGSVLSSPQYLSQINQTPSPRAFYQHPYYPGYYLASQGVSEVKQNYDMEEVTKRYQAATEEITAKNKLIDQLNDQLVQQGEATTQRFNEYEKLLNESTRVKEDCSIMLRDLQLNHQKELAELNAQLDDMRTQYNNLATDYDYQIKGARDNWETKVSLLEEQVTKLKEANEQKDAEILSLQESVRTKIQEGEETVRVKVKECATQEELRYKNTIRMLENRIMELEHQNEDLQKNSKWLKEENQRLERKIFDLEKRTADERSQNEAEIEKLNLLLREANDKQQLMGSEIFAKENSFQNLRREFENLTREVLRLKEFHKLEINKLEANRQFEKRKAEEENRRLDDKIRELESHVRNLKDDNHRILKEKERLQGLLEGNINKALTQTLEESRNRVSNFKAPDYL